MFYCWFKIGLIIALNRRKPLQNFEEEISIPFRVRLLDCDALRIMSAYQYPIYMNFSCWDLFVRSGLLSAAIKNRWSPLVGSQKIIYRKPLKRWTSFNLKASYAGWDENWFYYQHFFVQEDKVKAVGTTKIAAWKQGGIIPVKTVFEEAGINYEKKVPPTWVANHFNEDRDDLNCRKLDLTDSM